jgi:hypothetical protein
LINSGAKIDEKNIYGETALIKGLLKIKTPLISNSFLLLKLLEMAIKI